MDDPIDPVLTETAPELKALLGRFDAPAYARRGQRVEEARQVLLQRCGHERYRLGAMIRVRTRQAVAAAGSLHDLASWLAAAEEIERIHALWETVGGAEALPAGQAAEGEPSRARRGGWGTIFDGPAARSRRVRRALHALAISVARFNRRWLGFLDQLDLSGFNQQVSDYNRYYLLEKECALRSPRLARQGYRPLAPMRLEDLLAVFPPLAAPRARDDR